MDFPQIWPHLSTSSRSWLIEHNGEPLPDELAEPGKKKVRLLVGITAQLSAFARFHRFQASQEFCSLRFGHECAGLQDGEIVRHGRASPGCQGAT